MPVYCTHPSETWKTHVGIKNVAFAKTKMNHQKQIWQEKGHEKGLLLPWSQNGRGVDVPGGWHWACDHYQSGSQAPLWKGFVHLKTLEYRPTCPQPTCPRASPMFFRGACHTLTYKGLHSTHWMALQSPGSRKKHPFIEKIDEVDITKNVRSKSYDKINRNSMRCMIMIKLVNILSPIFSSVNWGKVYLYLQGYNYRRQCI